ncbi:hypothetical protein LXL04_039511 [Taraxacum kok-saghyz]
MPFRRAPSAKSSFLCEMDGYFGNVSFFRLFGGRLLWNLEFVKLEFINKLYGDNLERIFDSCDILGLIDPSIDDVSAWFRTIDCRGHDNGFAFAIECLVSDGRRPANCPPKPEATKTTASLNTTSLGTHKGKNVTKDQNTTKLPPC